MRQHITPDIMEVLKHNLGKVCSATFKRQLSIAALSREREPTGWARKPAQNRIACKEASQRTSMMRSAM